MSTSRARRTRARWLRALVPGLVAVALATALGVVFGGQLKPPDKPMLYLAAIVAAAMAGRAAGIFAAALSVALYNFFFVAPYYTLHVANVDDLITFAVMFVVGTAIGTLVARLRQAEAASRARERRTQALLALTSQTAEATTVAEVQRALASAMPDASEDLDAEDRALVEAMVRHADAATARLELANAAREAALRARAEELRSSLLSTVSHDLRTPLAAITGIATALRDAAPNLTDEQLESLDTIVDEAARLGAILHNLLAITRVESGAQLSRDWVPLEELVGAALRRLETQLAEHRVELALEPDLYVFVDAILFEQLLLNLLENAAKHTPRGTAIEIAAARSGDRVTLEVSDRGRGLPPGRASRLFEKFVRGPDVRGAGAGLGLAVCRGIALAHGGDIEACARAGGGATFRVGVAGGALPLAEASELAEAS